MPHTTKEMNLALALVGIDIIHKRFPLGGLNRKDVFESLGHQKYIQQFVLFNEFRDTLDLDGKVNLLRLLRSEIKGLFCGEMAQFVILHLKDVAPDTSVEMVTLSHHQMLVIGRKPGSNPKDIETWGEDAVICDPWARKFYEASQFKLEQSKGEKVTLIKSMAHNLKKSEMNVLESIDEYLAGTPRIGFS